MATRTTKQKGQDFIRSMQERTEPHVRELVKGPFVRGFETGTLSIEGVKIFTEQHYHLIMNDIANLSIYTSKARGDEEIDFFLLMVNAERKMLESLYALGKGVGMSQVEIMASKPLPNALLRTNYFSRLALYGTPGEIALAILLNFPLWAGGARRMSKGLKRYYGLSSEDTDLLDRFSRSTRGFRELAKKIISRDLTSEEARGRMEMVGQLAVEYELTAWKTYYTETLNRSRRTRKKQRDFKDPSARG